MLRSNQLSYITEGANYSQKRARVRGRAYWWVNTAGRLAMKASMPSF